MSQNAIPVGPDLVARIAAETLSKRAPDYAVEVRRLLDAALAVIARRGTTSGARVADIVAEAGLSNDAFYRHFASKDALVDALLQDGTERLASYIAHQMAKDPSPTGKVGRWVEGMLSQTRDPVAATTLAVLGTASAAASGVRPAGTDASAALGALLDEPFTALGSANPGMDASLVAHAVLGKVRDYLWAHQQPTRRELDHITRFCIDAARS